MHIFGLDEAVRITRRKKESGCELLAENDTLVLSDTAAYFSFIHSSN